MYRYRIRAWISRDMITRLQTHSYLGLDVKLGDECMVTTGPLE